MLAESGADRAARTRSESTEPVTPAERPEKADRPAQPKLAGWRAALARLRAPFAKLRHSRRRSRTRLPGRDPIWAYVAIALGTLLVLTSGTVVGGSEVLANRYERTLEKRVLLAPDARAPERPRQTTVFGPLNYLLLGSDMRPGFPGDSRSDTIIIVHVPATMDRAFLISVPRDLRVQIPPFEPTGFSGGREKINGAFYHGGGGDGGVALLSQTLTDLIGVRFDGAAIIDFTGFQKIVELLGGVSMCVDVRTVSDHVGQDRNGNYLHPSRGGTPVVYEPGCYDFQPWQALDYVRQRKSLDDGDFGRMRHQQQFLRAIFDKAQSVGATNPLVLDRLIRAIGDSLTVDIGGVSIDELLYALRELRPSRLLGINLPSQPDDSGGIAYIVGLPAADTLYQAIRDDTVDTWALENPTWINQL